MLCRTGLSSWLAEFPQLLQEEHPLLSILDEEADGGLPLEVLGDGGTQEAERVHSVDMSAEMGVYQGEGLVGLALSESLHLHCLLGIQLKVVDATPGHSRLPSLL